jgi:hypothetical protein
MDGADTAAAMALLPASQPQPLQSEGGTHQSTGAAAPTASQPATGSAAQGFTKVLIDISGQVSSTDSSDLHMSLHT